MTLLDDVFKAFMDTNIHQGRHFSFEDLLSISIDMNKRYFKFEHISIPYLATVSLCKGPDIDIINIKFYTPYTNLGPVINRYKSDAWNILDPLQAQYFPTLSSVAKTEYKATHVYYNLIRRRLDIKLYPKSLGTIGLIVSFAQGYAYMDDSAPKGNFP